MSLIDPVTYGKPWVLSKEKDPVSIPYDILKNFGRQDVIALDFLYRSYEKELNGVILNEEEDFNPQLQVSAFLGALYQCSPKKFLVLVLCPDDLIVKWHYYMTIFGKFAVKIINPDTVPEDFDQENGIVLLLNFTNLKLAEYLKEYDLFSVVIDKFDEVATKLAIRKLQGTFNIGITLRNFYEKRDQKVQWTMLNWANPGTVGKLTDFYEIDNDNFACFRDNYKEWWFRLTWKYCDSFIKPTLQEQGNINSILRDWGKTNNIVSSQSKPKRKQAQRKRKNADLEDTEEKPVESERSEQNKRPKRVYSKKSASKTSISYASTSKQNEGASVQNLNLDSDSSDSSDTIIYENEAHTQNEKPIKEEIEKSPEIGDNKPDDSDDEENSVSSSEQLLCSLARTKTRKLRNTKHIEEKIKQTEHENIDESDLFLRSVATTDSDLSLFKKRQKTEKFFDKILDDSKDKPERNALTQIEMELTEKEAKDVPAESDSFFKGIFNKEIKQEQDDDKERDCGNTSNIGQSDVDALIADVMRLVEKN